LNSYERMPIIYIWFVSKSFVNLKGLVMAGFGKGAGGRGGGRGAGRGQGAGRGRMGGPFAAGPGGQCVCPGCGYKVAHVVGQPCNQKACPQCGTEMIRA
jgi:hypothetical protein